MPYMDKIKIIYSVDGEERTIEFANAIEMAKVIDYLEVGTLYQVYGLRNNAWVFLEQHKTQPPARPWGGTFPD